MQTTLSPEELGRFFSDFKEEFRKQVFFAVKRAWLRKVTEELNRISVTGRVFNSLKPLVSSGAYKQNLVASIGKGHAARLLELGRRDPEYPFGESGRFMSFSDNPGLEEWAYMKLSQDVIDRFGGRGLIVGGDNTHFGRPINQWFTNSVVGLDVTDELNEASRRTFEKLVGGKT